MIWQQVATYLPPYWRMMLRQVVPHEVPPVPRRSEAYIRAFSRPAAALRGIMKRLVTHEMTTTMNLGEPGTFPADEGCMRDAAEYVEGAMDRGTVPRKFFETFDYINSTEFQDLQKVAFLHACFITDCSSKSQACRWLCAQLSAIMSRLGLFSSLIARDGDVGETCDQTLLSLMALG